MNVRNIDLQRKVKWKVKKEYDYHKDKVETSIKVGRFYTDFKDYIEYNPNSSIVEMDTVIGTQGGKGGKCFLTLLFRQYNFMLIYLLPYKKSRYVTEIFNQLKLLLGIDEFKRLFQVILTDNGTEFSDPESIEFDMNTGEKYVQYFIVILTVHGKKDLLKKIMNILDIFFLKELLLLLLLKKIVI